MTAPGPEGPLASAIALGEAFEAYGVAYAIGGALAYGVWGIPRATLDVDINVFVDETQLQPVITALQSLRIAVDRAQIVRDAAQEGMFIVRHGGHRIDVFTASIPFCAEAERTRIQVQIGEQRPWFLSAEALSVFKMLFFRPKDLADLERLVAVRGAALDSAYVRDQLVHIVGSDDVRIDRWDQLAGLRGAASTEEYEVESAARLRAGKVYTVLRKSDGKTFELELDRPMLGTLHDGDRVRITDTGRLEILGSGFDHSRGG